MFKPNLDEAKQYSNGNFKVIPVSMEIFSDIKTPIEVLKILKNNDNHCFLLESVEKAENWGRYSFLGFKPKMEITCQNGLMQIKEGKKTEKFECKKPQDIINKIIEDHKSPKFDFLPTFTGGLVGYFAYDFIKYFEPELNLDANDVENFKDVDLMLFDKIIAFDNKRQKIILIVNIKTDDIEKNYKRATKELLALAKLIKTGKAKKIRPGKLKSPFRPDRKSVV